MIGPVGAVRVKLDAAGEPESHALGLIDCGPAPGAALDVRTGKGYALGAIAPTYPGSETVQCQAYPDGSLLHFSGHLYNDREASLSDSDVVYNSFRQSGAAIFESLNGSFAFFLFDAVDNEMYLVTDRLGSWPILYAQANGYLYFAPELTAFNNVPGVSRSLNAAAVAAMLASGHMYGNDTYLKDVRVVTAGGYLHVAGGMVTERTYWRFPIQDDPPDANPARQKKECYELLVRSVERRLKQHPDAPLLMSGGTDSRAILGCFRELDYKPLIVSYAVDPLPGSDTSVAERLAQHTGCAFQYLHYTTDDILAYVRNSTAPYSCMRGSIYEYEALDMLRGQCNAVWLGDESFGWNAHALSNETDVLATVGVRPIDRQPGWGAILHRGVMERLSELDREQRTRLSRSCDLIENHNRKDFLYTMMRLPRNILLGRRYLATHVAAPLMPWLDYEILDFVSRTTIEQRMSKDLFRQVVEESFPDLFELPRAYSSGIPPDFRRYQRALQHDRDVINKGCFAGSSPIDDWVDAEWLRRFFDAARPAFLQSLRTAIKESRATNIAQLGVKASQYLRRRSPRVARHRASAGSALSPYHVLERIAQVRFYTAEMIHADADPLK